MFQRYFLAPLAALLLLAAAPRLTHAQTGAVGIGTTAPDASAALDIVSSSKGVLLPRVAAATSITNPAPGLLVYQTGGTAGFYYNAGTAAAPSWQRLSPGDNLGNHTATQALNLQGNPLVGTGDDLGTAVGVGIRADGGLNLGQNTGGNIYLGYQAGRVSIGGGNLFIGTQSGYSNTTGNFNQFSGTQSGYSNTTGHDNVFSGYRSGYSNTEGNNNLFSGSFSGYDNTTGSNNQFSGYRSGYFNTTGSDNVFSGYQSGINNTTGQANLFSGTQSGYSNTTGSNNVFSGYQSGYSNTYGNNNVFSGYKSGYVSRGDDNVFIGFGSGVINQSRANVFIGSGSGPANVGGYDNVFSGYFSGYQNTEGFENMFSGAFSGFNTTTGNFNVFVGSSSGNANDTGSNNTAIGYGSGPSSGNLINTTAIGFNAQVTQSNSLVLGGMGSQAVRVGIGTTAPSQKLEVVGNVKITGSGNGLTFPDGTTQTSASSLANLSGDVTSSGLTTTYNNVVPAAKGGAGTVSGLLKADGSGLVSAAVAGTDYLTPAGAGTNFIQNTTTQQANAAFNVAGAGTVGGLLTAGSATVSGNAVVAGTLGLGTTAVAPATQKLDVRGNVRLGADGGNVAGTGQAIEFVGPGFSTDPVGLYRYNPAADASELRVVVGDVSDANDKFVVGLMPGTNAEGGIPTGSFTPTFTVRADGNVGVGTGTPTSTLQVAGSVAASIRTLNSGTIAATDYTVIVTGSVSLPAPDATNSGRLYHLLNGNTNSNTVTGTFHDAGSSGTFPSFTLGTGSGGKGLTVQSDGTQWWIVTRE